MSAAGGDGTPPPQSATRVLALGLAALAVSTAAATLTLAIANRATIQSLAAADPISIVMPLTFAVVGGLIARAHPRNATGWLFLFIGVVQGLGGVADQYARLALAGHSGSLPGADWALWFQNSSPSLVYPTGAAAFLLMLLPDGHLPSRRWRPITAAAVLVATLIGVPFGALAPGPLSSNTDSSLSAPNPIGVPALQAVNQGPAPGVIFFLGLAILIAAAAAPLIRMRRSRGDEKQQLKWIAYAVLVSAIGSTAATLTFFLPWQSSNAQTVIFSLAIALGFGVAFPVAAAISIFKYRLYDVDIVISRTIVYGALAVFITAVYVGIAVGIGALAGGGGKPNLGLSILATAIVAVGFQPVRERLQRVANRLVYGKRATPYEVLSEFSAHVADTYAADEVLPRMARVLQEGTGAESATVWLRSGDQLRPAATYPLSEVEQPSLPIANGALPAIASASRSAVVVQQGEVLGALSIAKRKGEALTPIEVKLVDDLAHQAGLVLKNVGLTAELLHRLEELRISRQRLVRAQDEERRRLERNLHDGAQQHLVALKVKISLLETLRAKNPDGAAAMLTDLKSDADEALETLRELARGIYPPLLADKGLRAALEAQARKATLPVTIDADGVGRYPPDVEAAVYFCCLEALQNVQKYAKASRATVRLSADDSHLLFEVVDDGGGFDAATAKLGSGLQNMSDRIDALGGTFALESTPGAGASVRATLPVATSATGDRP